MLEFGVVGSCNGYHEEGFGQKVMECFRELEFGAVGSSNAMVLVL